MTLPLECESLITESAFGESVRTIVTVSLAEPFILGSPNREKVSLSILPALNQVSGVQYKEHGIECRMQTSWPNIPLESNSPFDSVLVDKNHDVLVSKRQPFTLSEIDSVNLEPPDTTLQTIVLRPSDEINQRHRPFFELAMSELVVERACEGT